MRKVAILTLGFVLVTSTLVLARGGPNPAGTRIEGVITDIDYTDQWIVVADVTVQATADTVILMQPCGGGAAIPILFEDLALGQTVRASGLMDGDELVAKKIMVRYGGE